MNFHQILSKVPDGKDGIYASISHADNVCLTTRIATTSVLHVCGYVGTRAASSKRPGEWRYLLAFSESFRNLEVPEMRHPPHAFYI